MLKHKTDYNIDIQLNWSIICFDDGQYGSTRLFYITYKVLYTTEHKWKEINKEIE